MALSESRYHPKRFCLSNTYRKAHMRPIQQKNRKKNVAPFDLFPCLSSIDARQCAENRFQKVRGSLKRFVYHRPALFAHLFKPRFSAQQMRMGLVGVFGLVLHYSAANTLARNVSAEYWRCSSLGPETTIIPKCVNYTC